MNMPASLSLFHACDNTNTPLHVFIEKLLRYSHIKYHLKFFTHYIITGLDYVNATILHLP